MAALEDRIRQLEDRASIEDLNVRYFLAADGDDVRTLRELFAPEASFSISGQIGGTSREGVIAFLVDQRRAMGLTVHTPHYVLLGRICGDHAEAIVGAHLELVLGGESLFGAVRYQDGYVRQDGRWMIARRDMRTIHIAPWKELDAAFRSERPVRWPGAAPQPSDFPRSSG